MHAFTSNNEIGIKIGQVVYCRSSGNYIYYIYYLFLILDLTVETDSPVSSVSGETLLSSIPTSLDECLER